MGDILLQWNATDTTGHPSVTGQRISKRIKAIGGAWDTSGFDTANDMADNVNENIAVGVTNNRVYEFKLESLCSEGGPVLALNGIVEHIYFECISPTEGSFITHNQMSFVIPLTGTDITKVKFTLRLTADDSIVGSTTGFNSGTQAVATFSGLTASTAYYLETEMYAMLNGVEVISSAPNFLNAVCTGIDYEFTTQVAPSATELLVGFGNSISVACAGATAAFISNSEIDVVPGIIVYVDAGLSAPATGWSYVRGQDGRVFHMNNTTGLVGAWTGASCGGTISFNNIMATGNIIGSGVTPVFYFLTVGTLPRDGSGVVLGIHGPSLGVDIEVPLTIAAAATLKLFVNAVEVDSVSAPTTGTYNLTGTWTAADSVEVRLLQPV